MQEPQLSRRRFLNGVGIASTLSVAGCTSLLQNEPTFQESAGRFLPGGSEFRGEDKLVTWYSPMRVYANREQLARINEYYLLNGKYQHHLGKFGLSSEDVSIMFQGPHYDLDVYEGTFSAQEVMDTYGDISVIDREEEYRGTTLWREQLFGMNNWMAFEDGRVIVVDQSTAWPDPYAGIKAVIDTLKGDHSSRLAAQPDFDAIMGELEPGLRWWYSPVADEPPLPGVRAYGSNTRVTDADEVATRRVYSFPEPPDVDSELLTRKIDAEIHHKLGSPTITRQNNLLIVEANAHIDEIANA